MTGDVLVVLMLASIAPIGLFVSWLISFLFAYWDKQPWDGGLQ